MRMSEQGRDWLAALEGGYRLHAYLDSAGIPTIGAGAITALDGTRIKLGDTWTLEAAQYTFSRQLLWFDEQVGSLTRDDLSQCEHDALVSFAYNVGIQGFRTSTLRQWVNDHFAPSSIRQQFMRWCYADEDHHHPGLEFSPGLHARRECEADCYESKGYFKQGESR